MWKKEVKSTERTEGFQKCMGRLSVSEEKYLANGSNIMSWWLTHRNNLVREVALSHLPSGIILIFDA